MRTLNDIAAAIFDIDGTLLDSSGIWEHLGEDFLLRRGIAPQPGLAGILAPMTIEESCRFLRENYSLPESTGDIRAALLSIISEFYRQECQLRPGAAPLVQELSGRGVRLVLATAGDRALSESALARCGILGYFSGIVTCAEYGSKSSPEIFRAAAGIAGFPPKECAVFEDSLAAVRTAKSAGFLTAAVGDVSEPQQELLKQTADYYRSTPGDYLMTR